MRRPTIDLRRVAVLGGLFVLAVAYAVVLVRPVNSASIGRDGAAPVIDFERLVGGQRIEAYLGITTKPLITLINGATYSIAGDWRPVAWAEILAFGLCVVLGAVLARRIAGPAAGAFVAIGLLVSPALLGELAFVHAIPWALLTWLIAGLAVTAQRPRWAVAGLALAVGTTARLETILVVVLAVVVLIAAELWTRRQQRPHPPRGAWLIALGFLALPVMLMHDGLLAGDPFLWSRIAEVNSDLASDTVQSPLWVTAWLIRHLLSEAALLPLGALGALLIVRRRAWALGVGLLALGPGVAAFVIFLAARHVFFSERYVEAMDLALVFAAGLGLGAIDVVSLRGSIDRLARTVRGPETLPVAASVLAGVIAAAAFAPIGPVDSTLRQTVANEVQLARNEQRAVAVIRPAIADVPSWRAGNGTLPDGRPRVLVPARVREQLVVDLGLSLKTVVRTTASGVDLARGRLVPGQIVYHDRLDDSLDPRYAALEIDRPTTIGAVRLVPLLADKARGMWILRIDSAPAAVVAGVGRQAGIGR